MLSGLEDLHGFTDVLATGKPKYSVISSLQTLRTPEFSSGLLQIHASLVLLLAGRWFMSRKLSAVALWCTAWGDCKSKDRWSSNIYPVCKIYCAGSNRKPLVPILDGALLCVTAECIWHARLWLRWEFRTYNPEPNAYNGEKVCGFLTHFSSIRLTGLWLNSF